MAHDERTCGFNCRDNPEPKDNRHDPDVGVTSDGTVVRVDPIHLAAGDEVYLGHRRGVAMPSDSGARGAFVPVTVGPQPGDVRLHIEKEMGPITVSHRSADAQAECPKCPDARAKGEGCECGAPLRFQPRSETPRGTTDEHGSAINIDAVAEAIYLAFEHIHANDTPRAWKSDKPWDSDPDDTLCEWERDEHRELARAAVGALASVPVRPTARVCPRCDGRGGDCAGCSGGKTVTPLTAPTCERCKGRGEVDFATIHTEPVTYPCPDCRPVRSDTAGAMQAILQLTSEPCTRGIATLVLQAEQRRESPTPPLDAALTCALKLVGEYSFALKYIAGIEESGIESWDDAVFACRDRARQALDYKPADCASQASGSPEERRQDRNLVDRATEGTNTTPARGPEEAGTTSRDRRAPVLSDGEESRAAPLTPTEEQRGREDCSTTSTDRACESCETRPASKWCNGCIVEDYQAQCGVVSDSSGTGDPDLAAATAWLRSIWDATRGIDYTPTQVSLAEAFAKVRAEEREACAKLCERYAAHLRSVQSGASASWCVDGCAIRIRGRMANPKGGG